MEQPAQRIAATALLVLALGAMAAMPPPAHAGAESCEAGKNGTAGKYVECLHKARKNLVTGGDVERYDEAVLACQAKSADKWQGLEAAAGVGVCPSEGDASAVRQFLDSCVMSIEDALAGAALPPDSLTCAAALATCNADLAPCQDDCGASVRVPLRTGQTACYDAAGTVVDCAGTGQDGELQQGAVRSFTDNGDGTITDNATTLMWEKLSDDDSIHDTDNRYSWSEAFATKIAALNAASFAGHDDWRLPNLFELGTLASVAAFDPATWPTFDSNCTPGCTVLTCSCTRGGSMLYWTSSTKEDYFNSTAWNWQFREGTEGLSNKSNLIAARAVRGGS